MSACATAGRGVESLAQRLAALQPGDPCPWCGEPLEEDGPRMGGGDRSETGILVCDACGCRLEPADAVAPSCRGGVYDLAA